jgi:dolichol-phosphate mannosyltransferase
MKIFLVLPAFNEEATLSNLLQACQEQTWLAQFGLQIIVVDDGSTDGTMRTAREWGHRLPIEVVAHRENRGLGETIRDGLARAVELAGPDDIVVAMDADNTQPVSLIPEMIHLLEQGRDIVIASRFQPGAKVVGLSAFRHFLTVCARVLYRTVVPIPGVRDYTCGFRAYRATLLKRAFEEYGAALVQERGFTCMAEILVKLARLGASVGEVPMILRYDQKLGASKMKVLATVRTSLKLLLSYRAKRRP